MPDSLVLWHNIKTTFSDVAVQYKHAQSVGTRARTGYYRAAFILLASIVEAMLYRLIEKAIDQDESVVQRQQFERIKKIQKVNSSHIGTNKTIYICEIYKENFILTPEKSKFSGMNTFCLTSGLIDLQLYKKIDKVVKKRKEIHLQGLVTKRRQYNELTLDMAGELMDEILAKIDSI